MEKLKVSLNKSHYYFKNLSVSAMTEMDGYLYITLEGSAKNVVDSNGKLLMSRTFTDASIEPITYKFKVVDFVSDNVIRTEIPTTRANNTINLIDYDYISGETEEFYIDFEEVHRIYNEDLVAIKINPCLNDYTITIDSENGDLILTSFTVTNQKQILAKMTYDEFKSLPEQVSSLDYSQNEFYGVDFEGNCTFWSDYSDSSEVKLLLDESSINIPIGLYNEVDYAHLNQSEAFNTLFESKYKDSVIPEVIDMEKLRFSPFILGKDNEYYDVKNMNFKMFFRSRDLEPDWKIDSGKTYTDELNQQIWNQFKNEKKISGSELNGKESDSLYLLNFQDSDIFYQKLKLKKSFIRLSFYDSPDVLSQKLMFYSTIFMDTNKMYNEYIKLLNDPKTNGTIAEKIASQISVTDCYDTTKSSEGFYLYIFKSDAPLENEEKTIYMKVEFNHAKYGRTIPLTTYFLRNPQIEGGEGEEITTSSYSENIYIPINLSYINYNGEWKYVYYPVIEQNNKKRTISSNITNFSLTYSLFEPLLRVDKTDGNN